MKILLFILTGLLTSNMALAGGMNDSALVGRQQISIAISANDAAMLVNCDGCQYSPVQPPCNLAACNLTTAQILDLFADTAGNAVALQDQTNEYNAKDAELLNVANQTGCQGSQCFVPGPGSTLNFGMTGGSMNPATGGGGFTGPGESGGGILPSIGTMLGWLGLNPNQVTSEANKNHRITKDKGVRTDGRGKIYVPGKGWIEISSLSTPDAMKKAGYTKAEIEDMERAKRAALKAKKKAEKTLLEKLKDYFDDEPEDEDDDEVSVASTKKQKGLQKSKPSLDGLARAFGEDQIGIQQDDIFKMVNRCYQEQRRTGQFLEK